MYSLIILGRQPELGIAELESLYGADVLRVISANAVAIDMEPKYIDFGRLGGMVKFAKVLTVLDFTDWSSIEKYLADTIPKHLGSLPEGKLRLGLSAYGIDVDVSRLNQSGVRFKKLVQKTGRSVRYVPNKEKDLNAAQILHNNLNGPLGWEILIVKDGNKTILAQTIAVQDIASYTIRDRSRPKRDSKVGMLPPKLAQIIINLACGMAENSGQVCGEPENKDKAVLDPFCGTGVVLTEAALMGYNPYGTDLEPRMIEYSRTNLDWLGEKLPHPPFTYLVEQGDATNHDWDDSFDFVASEVFLGRHFATSPTKDALEQTIKDVNTIITKFLNNLANQTKTNFRLCIAVPAWKSDGKTIHLPVLDSLEKLGYNRVRFERVSVKDLIYHREGQFVARQLVVLTRI